MADKKIHLFIDEKCNFPSHNEYLEINEMLSHERDNICEWPAFILYHISTFNIYSILHLHAFTISPHDKTLDTKCTTLFWVLTDL